MSDTATVTMILGTCVLPFAFVIAHVLIKAQARNRELTQIMEERKLMIERGMEPPPLKLPADEESRERDPLASLKTGVILLAVALGLVLSSFAWPKTGFMGALHLHFAQPAAIVVGVLGLGLIGLHFLVRAHSPRSGSAGANGTEEEGH